MARHGLSITPSLSFAIIFSRCRNTASILLRHYLCRHFSVIEATITRPRHRLFPPATPFSTEYAWFAISLSPLRRRLLFVFSDAHFSLSLFRRHAMSSRHYLSDECRNTLRVCYYAPRHRRHYSFAVFVDMMPSFSTRKRMPIYFMR